MRRSIAPQETQLVKLCHTKKWAEAEARARTYPGEANPTSSAFRGVGTTALAVAVRSGAPLETVKAIIDANTDQLLRVRHCRRSTVLHEAIRHRSSINVVTYLIDTIIKHEDLRILQIADDESRQVSKEAQKNRVHYTSLFSQSDDLGRTPLHHMTDRASRDAGRYCQHSGVVDACRSIAKAYPPAVGMADIDGQTPLILVLVTPPPSSPLSSNMELELAIFELVRIFLDVFPKAAAFTDPTTAVGLRSTAAISASQARLNERLERGSLPVRGGPQDSRRQEVDRSKPTIVGPNPLCFALMYGRSISLIKLLLESCPMSAHSSCTAIVSNESEVPLHIAITMRAPADVIALLLQYAPEAAAKPDKFGLTPLSWAWIRHVVDRPFLEGGSGADDGQEGGHMDVDDMGPSPLPPIKASKRRYLPINFSQLLDEAVEEIEAVTNHSGTSSRRVYNASFHRCRAGIGALWEKAALMLPSCAGASFLSLNRKEALNVDRELWPVVHSASFVSCPRALLDLAIYYYPDQVRLKDARGNLPIHYAVNRSGFVASQLPVGVTQAPQRFAETSPVYELLRQHPESCRVTDARDRLPIHIAIEFAKVTAREAHSADQNTERKHPSVPSCRTVSYAFGSGNPRGMEVPYAQKASLSIVLHILDKYTGALERKDRISMLYPFMQAAEGEYADHTMIYLLLQEHPTLVSLGIRLL